MVWTNNRQFVLQEGTGPSWDRSDKSETVTDVVATMSTLTVGHHGLL